MKKRKQDNIKVRVHQSTLRQLDKISALHNITRSELIRALLTKYLTDLEKIVTKGKPNPNDYGKEDNTDTT